jgi:hypothetical protein
MSLLLRRWWITVPVILVVLILGFLAALRSVGAADLAAARAELKAAGEPEGYAAWRALPLPGDPVASDALRAALAAFPHQGVPDLLNKAFSDTYVKEATAARIALATALGQQATAAAAVRTALAAPGAVINARHRLPVDPAEAAKAVLGDGLLVVSLLNTRELACHLAGLARLDTDPTALADLRHLVTSLGASDFLIDAMIMFAIQAISDETHLALARDGRLSDADRDAWIAGVIEPLPMLDRAFTAERCGFADLLWSIGPDVTDHIDGPSFGPLSGLWWWAVSEGDAAFYMRSIHRFQIAARTGTGSIAIPQPSGLDRWTRTMSFIAIPNLGECLISGQESDARLRMARAAALVIRDGGSPAAIAPLLDRGPTRIRLGFEKLGATRVRIAMDLGKPQPGVLDVSRYRADRCIGAPQRPGAFAWDREGLEFELP